MNNGISNIEAEKYLLLACIYGNYNEVLAEMPANMGDMFERQEHRILFKGITEIVKSGAEPEIKTIGVWLMKNNYNDKVDGNLIMPTERTRELIPKLKTKESIEFYINTVADCYANRKILAMCQNAIASINDGFSSADVLGELSKTVSGIRTDRGGQSRDSHAIVADFVKEMEAGTNTKAGLIFGYPKTFYQIIGGLQAGQIMTIGARTSVGKSLVICNIMRNVSLRGKKVVYFDLEMNNNDFASRLLAPQARVDTSFFKHSKAGLEKMGKLGAWDKIQKAQVELAKGEPIDRHDITNLTIEQIVARIKASNTRKHIDLIVIDHIGLVRASKKDESPRMTISGVTKAMKAIAKELGVAVILGSQINRAGADYPKLEYLKESGSIEEDSDIVALLHRPSDEELNEDNKHNLEVFFAKNRAGRKAIVTMWVDFGCQLMCDGYIGKPRVGAFSSEVLDKKSEESKEAVALFKSEKK